MWEQLFTCVRRLTDLSHSKTFLHETIFFSVPLIPQRGQEWENLITSTVIWWTLSVAIHLILCLSLACSSLGMVLRGARIHQPTADILWMSFTHLFPHFHPCNIMSPTYCISQCSEVHSGPFLSPCHQATRRTSPAVLLSPHSSVCTQVSGDPVTQPHHTGLLETDLEQLH